MSEQLSERGKDLVKYMPQAVNALADRLIEKLEERVLYGEKPSNADRIRAMSDEDLAMLLQPGCPSRVCRDSSPHDCYNCWLDWLKQGAKDDET